MKHIFDGQFKYVPALETNVKKTFDRIRKQQKEAEDRAKEEQQRVTTLPTRKRAP